ncbi:MAG: guanosine polyphosphate pyrophosphohydrolase [Sphingobacteriales bacterium UTBCD1]|jgi:guanosine-3',5'-bis(diphosphate) 3'-pyrophosphohydrolase|nr:MAG: guanosine polyphosphate pyrophosphohydrolase [Sphingobacteriales bacterium UTBCD1]
MDIQSTYQQAIKFAAAKHTEKNQLIPGSNLPYVVHLSNVAMEIFIAYQNLPDFKLDFAVTLALLHDTLEDTSTTFSDLSKEFGIDVARGVSALTKNKDLPKQIRMADSLNRIMVLPKEVGAVKLADRITNLQKPPDTWDTPKKEKYRIEAIQILQALKGSNSYLEKRLSEKITEYEKYIKEK